MRRAHAPVTDDFGRTRGSMFPAIGRAGRRQWQCGRDPEGRRGRSRANVCWDSAPHGRLEEKGKKLVVPAYLRTWKRSCSCEVPAYLVQLIFTEGAS